jgi:23S rRNA (guanosine2251-2'-O)-methyltransferase
MKERLVLAGKRAVFEALKSGKNIEEVFFLLGRKHELFELLELAQQNEIKTSEVDAKKLSSLYCGVHQGVVAITSVEYLSLEDLLEKTKKVSERGLFLIVLDHLNDPHNLGAIVRTAAVFGVDGVIIPKDRSVRVTSTVLKVAAGGCEYVPVVMVRNIAETVAKLKAEGIWVYATGLEGEDLFKTRFAKDVAIVVGSEDKGVSRLVRERSSLSLTIPMPGERLSLNVSVAAGIVMAAVAKQKWQEV